MLLRLSKIEEVDIITNISISSFHSDYQVGLSPNDGPPGYDNIEWYRKMQSESHLYSYIDENNLVIGGAVLFLSNDTLYIGRIFISPIFHRNGFGIKLMEDIENMFKSFKRIKLDTLKNNIRTNSLYKKLGYTLVESDGDFNIYIKDNINNS